MHDQDLGPAALIAQDGRTLQELASAAGLALSTVFWAKKKNKWPAQRRVRLGLRRVLGLPDEVRPAFPRQADTPEAVQAEIDRMHGIQTTTVSQS